MPPKNKPSTPQHLIDEAVKRHMHNDEPVSKLSKHYKISRAQMYNWIKAAKIQILEQSRKGNLSPAQAELSDKRVLIAENEALKMEVRKLRDKVVTMMIKLGEI